PFPGGEARPRPHLRNVAGSPHRGHAQTVAQKYEGRCATGFPQCVSGTRRIPTAFRRATVASEGGRYGMKEMLLVGRGGEGVVLASQLLADALARAGYFVQSFPEFKAERRGAPIAAYLRWDEEPIHRRYK